MAAWRTFRTLRKKLAPRWLTEGDGELVGYVSDLIKDAFIERVRLGHLARFPESGPNGTTAPPDALAALGRDRRMYRGIDETDVSYASRLTGWLDEWRTAGNPFTLMRQLHDYCDSARAFGMSFRTVDNRGNWYSRSSAEVETSSLDTGNWDWDDLPASRWARFWVIVYPGTRWTIDPDAWGDPLWGETNHVWGCTILPDQAATLRAIVADWKPEGTRCNNIILAFDPASFATGAPEPDGLWGRWSRVTDGVRVASRLSTARYMDGT